MAAGGRRRPPTTHGPLPAAVVASTALVMGLLSACTPSPPAPPQAGDDQVEVFTWWASGSEKQGLDALAAVFAEQHPDTRFVNGAIAGGAGSAAKDVLLSRLANDDPPDTFQVHAGAELAELAAAGQLEPLGDLYAELDLEDALPGSLLELLTSDGVPYAVPSNVHRANVLWANPDVLRAAGLEPDATYATLADWFGALEAVQDVGVTPLALGSTWTQVHLLEQVLLAHLGPQDYSGLWTGDTDPGSPDVTAALEDFDRLLAFSNADRDRLDWQDATQRVIDGSAAFTVMGDWALPAFQEAGDTIPDDVTWAPVPGTAGAFTLIVDAFTLPVGAPHPESARRWLRTVASAEGQAALSGVKGSIPARSDVEPQEPGSYEEAAVASFHTDTSVPSLTHGTAAGTDALAGVTSAVAMFTRGSTSVAQLQQALVDALA